MLSLLIRLVIHERWRRGGWMGWMRKKGENEAMVNMAISCLPAFQEVGEAFHRRKLYVNFPLEIFHRSTLFRFFFVFCALPSPSLGTE